MPGFADTAHEKALLARLVLSLSVLVLAFAGVKLGLYLRWPHVEVACTAATNGRDPQWHLAWQYQGQQYERTESSMGLLVPYPGDQLTAAVNPAEPGTLVEPSTVAWALGAALFVLGLVLRAQARSQLRRELEPKALAPLQ